MLTLTRKAGQKIRIGEDIEIVVREIRGRQVRLGISAPNGMPVYREELYQQIAAEGGQLRERVRKADDGSEDLATEDLATETLEDPATPEKDES